MKHVLTGETADAMTKWVRCGACEAWVREDEAMMEECETPTRERPTVWVCLACGKRSRDRYGNEPINRGWDSSCFLNAVLVYEDAIVLGSDRVVEITEGGLVSEAEVA